MKKHSKTRGEIFRLKTVGAALVIIVLAAVAVFSILSHDTPPADHNNSTKVAVQKTTPQSGTLRDLYGEEFTSDDIIAKFNAFMRDAGADSLSIKELVLEPGETEDTYRDVKNNEDISIFMTARKGSPAVTSISVLARSGDDKPTAFITYCLALMNIFTPTMSANIQQRTLYNMMGYEEGADKPLADENTYIIMQTKYIFTCSRQKGLSMLIEQMPEVEEVSEGELPPLTQ
jgi:hypothetical protein